MHMTTVDYSQVYEYIDYLDLHGRRPLTLKQTRCVCMRLLRTLSEDGRPTRIEEITEDDVYWLYDKLGETKSDEVRFREIGYLSRMSDYFGGPHWIKRMDILRNRYEPDRVWLSVEDYGRLYYAAEPTERMILVLGALMGLRRAEIAGLEDDDIDLRAHKMTICGKGHGNGLVQIMDIPPMVADEIRTYRAWKGNGPRSDARLIQVQRAGRWTGVVPNRIYMWMDALGERVGIKVTTHALRRLYASTLVNIVEADLDTVRRLMRHSDITTTLRCYVHADPSKMHAAQDGLSAIMRGTIRAE